MKSNRSRGTSITVSPTFGSQLKHLRLQKKWSQKELSRQTTIVDRIGISKRIIGTIERSESLRFDRRTLDTLAKALDLSLDSLLDRTPPFTQPFPSLRPTTLFTKTLEEIRLRILDGEQLLVIEGESGIGKSRLASSLFSVDLPHHIVLWFTGQTITDFEKLIYSLTITAPNSSQRYVILLDEDHQPPVRNTEFFLGLFQLLNLDVITDQLTLICSIRSETYQALSDLEVLTKTYLVSLQNTLEQLDDYRAWKLDQPISPEERQWLLSTLTGDREQPQLNTFLLDRICIPVIRQKSWTQFNSQDNQVIETVYQGLIQNQPTQHRLLYRAIQWAVEMSGRSPLYLVNAVLNIQLADKKMTVQQTRNMLWRHKLTRIEQRPFFEQKPIWKNVYYTTCRFSHDLIKETVRVKHPFLDEIDLDLVVEELIDTIQQQKNQLATLVESVSSWLSLLDQQNRGFPQLAKTISSRIKNLIGTGQVSALEVGYHVFTMCWFLWGNKFKDRNDLKTPTIFKDIEIVTESIVSRFQPQDLEVLCQVRADGGSGYPLISCFSGWFASLGLHSGQLKREPFWGLLESEIPCLSDMARRLTEQPLDPSRFSSSTPALTPATLYIWSSQYKQTVDYINHIHDAGSIDPQFTETNFNCLRLLSHTGNLPQLVALYKKIVRTNRLNSVRTFYQKRIIKIESDQWSIQSNFGYRDFEKSFTEFDTYDSKEEIMVIDSSDMNQSFAMGEFLETSQIEYRIIDGIALDDLSQLPDKGRFIMIGKGFYSRMIDLVSRHLSKTNIEQIVQNFNKPPHFGWEHFNIDERELVWITGGWEEKRKEGVVKWHDSEEGKKFLGLSD